LPEIVSSGTSVVTICVVSLVWLDIFVVLTD
jgi:hypothetical protein